MKMKIRKCVQCFQFSKILIKLKRMKLQIAVHCIGSLIFIELSNQEELKPEVDQYDTEKEELSLEYDQYDAEEDDDEMPVKDVKLHETESDIIVNDNEFKKSNENKDLDVANHIQEVDTSSISKFSTLKIKYKCKIKHFLKFRKCEQSQFCD